MNEKYKKAIDDQIAASELHDTPHVTVKQHHFLTLGILSGCYNYVPHEMRMAIAEALQIGKEMGMPINVDQFMADKQSKLRES